MRACNPQKTTEIIDAYTSSKSVVLVLRKPPGWGNSHLNRAGMYAFLKIPAIASHEWHPFTISSAPDDDFVRFHIRAAGDWTKKLYNLIEDIDAAAEDKDAATRFNAWKSWRAAPSDDITKLGGRSRSRSPTNLKLSAVVPEGEELKPPAMGALGSDIEAGADGLAPPALARCISEERFSEMLNDFGAAPAPRTLATAARYPPVVIEGPIGAPSELYFRYKHSILITAGIGVTPMASVMRELVYHWYGAHIRGGLEGLQGAPADAAIESVDFHWTSRDQEALRWFAEELSTISGLDKDGRMDVNLHLTSVKPKESKLLRGVVDEVHRRTGGWDPISGVKSRFKTDFGRPDWDDVFSSIALRHTGETIGVFFCGPPRLSKILEEQCWRHSITTHAGSSTIFEYHSENF
mmetsp:Transcript_31624/g.100414  ORF Transcript_31624/g.100414 Transcript_31624/m.100414 type:complete len:407 (-) Transcript_31624:126-1346(-)